MYRRKFLLALLLATVGVPHLHATPASPPHRVTILYDAFGGRAGLTRDWGFAALVEYGGKRILFDAGNNDAIFARNVRALGIDLTRLDFVVISHRHGDHTSGLSHVLRQNPKVKVYAPREAFGGFGSVIPASFYRRDPTLPDSMRYFAGSPVDKVTSGAVWPEADILWIDTLTQVAPGLTIISTVSRTPGTLELRELSLVVHGPEGSVLLVGCSHPGIETILQASRPLSERVQLIFGGLHLPAASDTTISRIVTSLK